MTVTAGYGRDSYCWIQLLAAHLLDCIQLSSVRVCPEGGLQIKVDARGSTNDIKLIILLAGKEHQHWYLGATRNLQRATIHHSPGFKEAAYIHITPVLEYKASQSAG